MTSFRGYLCIFKVLWKLYIGLIVVKQKQIQRMNRSWKFEIALALFVIYLFSLISYFYLFALFVFHYFTSLISLSYLLSLFISPFSFLTTLSFYYLLASSTVSLYSNQMIVEHIKTISFPIVATQNRPNPTKHCVPIKWCRLHGKKFAILHYQGLYAQLNKIIF